MGSVASPTRPIRACASSWRDAACAPVALFAGGIPHAGRIYLGAAGYLFTMHLCFSVEGFIDGQPDVRRSGRIFSLAAVLLLLMLWAPLLAAPATAGGFADLPRFYREWLSGGMEAALGLPSHVRSLFSRRFL